jgi:hypothetical protein
VNNKEQKLLIWVLVGAGVLLALLYSPIGSPEDYVSSGYRNGAIGVDFKDQFQNVRYASSIYTQSSQPNDMGLPTASLPSTRVFENNNGMGIGVEVKNSESVSQRRAPIQYEVAMHQGGDMNTNNATYAVQISDNAITNQSDGGGGNSIGFADQSATFAQSNSRKNNQPITSGLVAMNLDLTVFGDLNRQGLGASTNDITDPGGDPTGPPIPVPDGFWFLLTMALSYLCWISIFKKKLKKSEII